MVLESQHSEFGDLKETIYNSEKGVKIQLNSGEITIEILS
jgi:hypothetical protein